MRLIDAEALKAKTFGKRGGLVHTSDIDAAPTVDAIPISWLRKKQKQYIYTELTFAPEVIEGLIIGWKKEQALKEV